MLNNINHVIGKYQTPMYVYDWEMIESKYHTLSNCLLPRAKLYYSMKANPLLGICQLLHGKGCGIEVASKGELTVALKAGCQAENIIFTSPGKTYDEICFAVDNRIKMINIESYEEAVLVNEVAKNANRCVKIAMRVNPAISNSNAKIKMSGVSSQFGVDEELLDDHFFKRMKELTSIELVGIQVYMGTQMLASEDIINNTKNIIEIALKLSAQHGFQLEYLNMGGGFGVPYFKNEIELDMDAIKKGMSELDLVFGETLKDTELVFESGRYLMAESGVYATKVLYRKQSKGKEYVVCDGGSNFHASSAFLGRFVRNNFPLHTIPESEEQNLVNIVGPLCTPTDFMGQKVYVNRELTIGDYVVIDNSGAYGLTHSPLRFLSHETPLELLVSNNEVQILRERGNSDDILRGQNEISDGNRNETV